MPEIGRAGSTIESGIRGRPKRVNLMVMAKGNEKFIRRQKEVERQKAQEAKRKKRAERHAEGKTSAADDDIAATPAAIDAGIDPNSLRDESAAGEGDEEQPQKEEEV